MKISTLALIMGINQQLSTFLSIVLAY